jgi:hypothetical protein
MIDRHGGVSAHVVVVVNVDGRTTIPPAIPIGMAIVRVPEIAVMKNVKAV